MRASAHPIRLSAWLPLWCAVSLVGALAVHFGTMPSLDSWLLRGAVATSTVISAPGWVASVVLASSTFGERFGEILLITASGVACTMTIASMLRRAHQFADSATPHADEPPSASRRRFLLRGVTAVGALSATGVGVYASLIEPYRVRTTRYRIPINNLPESLDGLRMVQISDTHLGRNISREFVSSVVQRAIDLDPDLFLLTGDYVYGHRRFIEPAAELFEPLVKHTGRSRGVLAVLGNHDWAHGGYDMRAALDRIGVRMIDNDRLFLDAKTRSISDRLSGAESLAIAGIGDLRTTRPNPALAFRGAGEEPTVVLAHNPDTAEHDYFTSRPNGSPRVDLMISGHTHGGQIRLPIIGAPYMPSSHGEKYLYGLARGPRFPVLITSGVGMSGPPIRIGAPPEIVEITLIRA